MQLDPNFVEAVRFLRNELAKTQIPNEAWISLLSGYTHRECSVDPVRDVVQQFSETDAVLQQFSLQKLKAVLDELITRDTEDGTLLTVGEIQAASMQANFLLDLQRYYGRRKVGRARRIVNAAHRRAILAHDEGPLQYKLQVAVENLLAQS